jgi:hypothetical protein
VYERAIGHLEEERGSLGEFWLEGFEEDDGCQGILRWDPENGVELRLLNPPAKWPVHNLNEKTSVRGVLSDHPSVLITNAYVGRHHHGTQVDATLRSGGLLLGMEGEPDEEFSAMRFRTAHMHEWLGATGLKTPDHEYEGDRVERVGIEWRPEEPVRVGLGDAELTLSVALASNADFSPDQKFDTHLNLRIVPKQEMRVEEIERRFQRPLVVFSTLVADRFDSVTMETLSNERHRFEVQVLHAGRTVTAREWHPDSAYLFRAEDCEDPRTLLLRWYELYAKAGLPLAVYAETLREPNSYYPGRLIQSVSALEGYCTSLLGRGKKLAGTLKKLRNHAGVEPAVTKCTDETLELIASARNYYTHLEARGVRGAEELEGHLVDCCRWCTALIQSCLLVELGFSADRAGELIEAHYINWPLPDPPKLP